MNEVFSNASEIFARSGVVLAVGALVIFLTLRLLRPRAPLTHRMAWGGVLLCGGVVFHWSLEIPWYEAANDATEIDRSAANNDLPELAALASSARADQPDARASSGPIAAAETKVGAAVAQPHSANPWTGFYRKRVFVGIWISGMVVVIGISAMSYLLLLSTVRRAVPADGEWRAQWQDLLESSGVREPIPLVVHARLGPMLCRLPRGYVVVVPHRHWARFTREERLAILRHELAHYRRGDIWTSLVARLLAVPHWYNPFAWWAVRKFEEGGEWACDEQLLSDPQQVPVFARALLSMTEAESNRVCATAARGSSLAVRLKRLLSFRSQEDSLMKRCLLFAVLTAVLVAAVFRIQLVAKAQEEEAENSPVTEREITERIDEFRSKLYAKNLEEFKDALGTKAGRIVLRDHVSVFDERLRDRARNAAIPDYLDKRFIEEDGRLKLRDDQQEYRDQFLATVETFNEDITKVKTALQGLSAQIDPRTETDRLLVRFMNHDASANMLYIEELRQRLRPDVRVIERLLGEIFVDSGNGTYKIRPGRRDEAAEYLARVKRIRKSVKPIHAELKEWSTEFVEQDDFHRRVKTALADRVFASFIAAELIGDYDGPVSERLDEFFENMGEIAVDTAEGLEVIDEGQREELANALDRFDQTRLASEKLAKPLKVFAASIDTSDPLEQGWSEILSSDLAIVRIGDDYEFVDADPAKIVRALLSEVLDESDDGKLFVQPGRAEELTEHVREFFRQYRSVRAKGRSLDEPALQIDDEELRDAFQSNGGKFVVLMTIQKSFQGAAFDGFQVWLAEHFEENDEGLALREGGEEMVQDFIDQVAEVTEELAKDDF